MLRLCLAVDFGRDDRFLYGVFLFVLVRVFLKILKTIPDYLQIGSLQLKVGYFHNLVAEHSAIMQKIVPTSRHPGPTLCEFEELRAHPEINEIIYKRIIELAKVNFEKKVYLYLVEGKGSVEFAEKKNENIEDDNNLIYISIDDFINAKEITKGKELYNSETKKLMEKR